MNRFLPFLTAALSLTMIGPALTADRVALVIGVDDYKNLPPEAQLRVAASDATLMAQTLESLNPPFDVTLLTNVSQDDAERALDAFVGKAEGAECALVYFAGHGIEFHGENFLLVNDTDIAKISADVPRMKRRLGNEALSLQAWVDSLDATGALVKVVILDACRDNPLEAESVSGTRSVVGGKGGLAQVTPPSGSLISYSADAGQQANDGLFTKVLTGKMKIPNLSMLEMFAATREEVLSVSTQLAAQEQGVRHEPAEYTKLNRAGTRFSFMAGPGAVKMPTPVSKPAEPKPAPMMSPGFLLSRAMLGKQTGEQRSIQGMNMVWCPLTGPEGFTMGSPPGEQYREEDETAHQVVLSEGFWVGKYECTQAEWVALMGSNPSKYQGGALPTNLPVESVSFTDVEAFLKKMNKEKPVPLGWRWALPTEAQWEYACRAGTESAFSFGNVLTTAQANYDGKAPVDGTRPASYYGISKPVGTYPANAWGIHEMHANVWEFCSDRDHLTPYPAGPVTDPVGPDEGEYRIIRGGSFYDAALKARSANRDRVNTSSGMLTLGFRVALVYQMKSLGEMIGQ